MPSQTVYLDRDQCAKFNVPYFDAGKLAIAADTLRKSKASGYDSAADAELATHEQDTLVLERTGEDAPGWFTVTKVIPSFARPKAVRDAWKLANGIA